MCGSPRPASASSCATARTVPDLATPEAFKQALMAAKSIVYGDVLPNQSGEKVEKILATLGILDALRPKIRIVSGHRNSQPLIAKGEVEMGLYNLSEIHEGNGHQARRPGARAAAADHDLGGRLDVGRLGAGGGAGVHPLPGRAPTRATSGLAAKLEPLGEH